MMNSIHAAMLCRVAAFALFFLLSAISPTSAQNLDIDLLTQRQVRPGSPLRVQVSGAGTIGIYSDFSAQSSQIEVQGTREVDVGPVDAPGLFTVALVQGDSIKPFTLLILPSEDGQLELHELHPSDHASSLPGNAPVGLLERFGDAVDGDRLIRIWERHGTDILGNRAVEIASIGVYIVVGAGTGGAVWGLVAVAAGDFSAAVAVDLFKYLVIDMQEEDIFTTDEATTLQNWALGANVVRAFTSGFLAPYSNLKSGLVNAASQGSIDLIENDDVELTVKSQSDLFTRTLAIIRVLK